MGKKKHLHHYILGYAQNYMSYSRLTFDLQRNAVFVPNRLGITPVVIPELPRVQSSKFKFHFTPIIIIMPRPGRGLCDLYADARFASGPYNAKEQQVANSL